MLIVVLLALGVACCTAATILALHDPKVQQLQVAMTICTARRWSPIAWPPIATSIFVKDDDGAIIHSYSTYHRGAELLMGALNWLDFVPRAATRAPAP